MHIVYIDKCRDEIQKQKEVPVRYTRIYWSMSSTGIKSSLRYFAEIRAEYKRFSNAPSAKQSRLHYVITRYFFACRRSEHGVRV
jgi:hypothetical protein